MVWPTPRFSRNQISKAGDFLAKHSGDFATDDDLERWIHSYEILANWRACHGYPINTFQATLRTRLKKIDPEALVAQRLKRTPSILNKLQRFKGMNLARMQDIGGLRAVVASTRRLEELNEAYIGSKLTHELVSQYDYVRHPKPSGYRSITWCIGTKVEAQHRTMACCWRFSCVPGFSTHGQPRSRRQGRSWSTR